MRISGRGRAVQRGFSLIELLVTVAIIGILSAIAVPSYDVLRKRFFDATALSDVANAGKAVEGLNSQAAFSVSVLGPTGIKEVPGPRVSTGTTLTVTRTVGNNGEAAYQVTGTHLHGTGATYVFTRGRLYLVASGAGNTNGNGNAGNAGNANGNGNAGNAAGNGNAGNAAGNGNAGNAAGNGNAGNAAGNGNAGNAAGNGNAGNAAGNGNANGKGKGA